MELEVAFFKRILRYWILHHEDFSLLQDASSLSEELVYYDRDLLGFDCFKSKENPWCEVTKKSCKEYVRMGMIKRFNAYIPKVVSDMQKEWNDLDSKCARLMTEIAEIQSKDVCSESPTDTWSLVQLGFDLKFTNTAKQNLEKTLTWLSVGNPHFVPKHIQGTTLWVQLVH